MPNPARTVELSKALATVKPEPEPSKAEKKVRFIRTMSPEVPVELGNDSKVYFHVPVNNRTGEPAAYGWYETSDPSEIAAIREVVREKPYLFVFEEPLPQK